VDLVVLHSVPGVGRDDFLADEVRDVLHRKAKETRLAHEGDVLALAVTVPGAADLRTGVIGEVSMWWRSVEPVCRSIEPTVLSSAEVR